MDQLRIVVPRYGSAVVGGAETAMRRLAQALAVRGWSVECWTTTALDEATWAPGFEAGEEMDGGVVVRRFAVQGGRRPWLFRRLSNLAYHAPSLLRPERAWAWAQGPWAPRLVRALAGADPLPTLFSPYLYAPTLYGLPTAPHPRILCPAAHDEPALRLGLVRRALVGADALWFHSLEERELVAATHPATGLLPWRCGVVGVEPPLGIDPDAFASRHRISGPYLYFGGRAAGDKGVEVLLSAIALLRRTHPDASLVLSGEPHPRADQPWVRRVGFLDERERWEAIAGATAVVVPSRMESLSLLALEAWAVGRPCLLNAGSAVLAGHAKRSGGGLTFRDPAELAARAARLLDHPDQAVELGKAGRAYVVATYRWDLVEQRLRELITEATA